MSYYNTSQRKRQPMKFLTTYNADDDINYSHWPVYLITYLFPWIHMYNNTTHLIYTQSLNYQQLLSGGKTVTVKECVPQVSLTIISWVS